jgi:hypothetical protein
VEKVAKKYSMTGADLLEANSHYIGISLKAKLRTGTRLLVPEESVGSYYGSGKGKKKRSHAQDLDGSAGGAAAGSDVRPR